MIDCNPEDVLIQMAESEHGFCVPGEVIWNWWCPGCECLHWTRTKGSEPCWGWDGSTSKPTFTPSVLVRSGNASGPTVCHSFVTNGVIHYLDDCTHPLKGQNVPMILNKDWI